MLKINRTNMTLEVDVDGVWHYAKLHEVPPPPVYGLKWEGPGAGTYTRTGDAVGLNYAAGVGSEVVQNDWDEADIYSKIEDVEVDGDFFVKIPLFYYRMTIGTDFEHWEITPGPREGFKPHEAFVAPDGTVHDHILFGKHLGYVDDGKLRSWPNVTPTRGITLPNFRLYAQANGGQLLDYTSLQALRLLIPIEMGTHDVQSYMAGLTSASGPMDTGYSSLVASSSGSPTHNTNGSSPAVWRGIESPWGNIWQWTDGVNMNDGEIYVNSDPSTYASGVFVHPYEKISYTPTTTQDYIQTLGFDPDHPYARFPTSADGIGSTSYKDRWYVNTTGSRALRSGGRWINGASAGLFSSNFSYAPSRATSDNGSRLLKKPF